jgi:hypothetical protein
MKATHQQSQNRRDKDDNKNDLNLWNGAALLVADCMGTGVSIDSTNCQWQLRLSQLCEQSIVLYQLIFQSWFL